MSRRPLAVALGVTVLIVAVAAAALLALGWERPQQLFGDKVGLIEVRGVISDAQPVLDALGQFRRDDDVKAVVLRVDSPGGGVAASQEIYRQVTRFKAAKPVVCSMGGVAASGGFYISAPCTRIVANPGSITGSIGVISTIPDLQGLMAKLGVRIQTIKTGALKGAGQFDRPLTDAEREMIASIGQDLYEQFLGDVSRARHIPVAKLRPIADGRVFSGRKAKQLGLVDELGNLVDAVRLAAKLGGIKGEPKVVRPESQRENWLRKVLREESRSLIEGVLSGDGGGPQYLYRPSGQ